LANIDGFDCPNIELFRNASITDIKNENYSEDIEIYRYRCHVIRKQVIGLLVGNKKPAQKNPPNKTQKKPSKKTKKKPPRSGFYWVFFKSTNIFCIKITFFHEICLLTSQSGLY
jgi:hypothetical protein